MEINKQLFEDILSGKLKGTFVLRNGRKISSNKLTRSHPYYSKTHPYQLVCPAYTSNGLSSVCDLKSCNDIIDFIPDTNMKENELTIEIPDGKIAHVEYIGNKINVTFEDKQLVKIVKHYNDGSIEIEERM